ncbi:MAG: tetratricopeptide repeat protein, partial [Pseudomonadota bacterium]
AAFGIAEDLINRLSRLRWLPVIARSSSFSIPPEARSPREAGARLGARYVIEGSLNPAGDGFAMRIGLTDAQNGTLVWSDAVELAQLDGRSNLETAMAGITAALDHRVDQSEQSRALVSQADNGDARQLVWQARWHFAKLTDEAMHEAERLLDSAKALAPMSAEILIEQAWLTIRKLWLRRGTHDEIRSLRKLAQRASNADPDDARGYMVCGIAEFWLQQPDRAERLFKRAIELNPSLVMAHAQLGSCLHHRGACEEAIATLERARRLSPNDQDLFFTQGELAMAHLMLGQCEKAIDHAEASLARRAAYWSAHVAKINAHVRLEQWEAARTGYDELMEAQPLFRPHFIDWLPYRDASTNAALREGLNLARPQDD